MEGLEIERRDAALVATVERGDQNSFSGEMIDALADAVVDASTDSTCRFVRLRARGPVFCVARDRQGSTPDELRAEATRIVRINQTLATTPLVVVAEVSGDAAGFGFGLVAASDVAVASEAARFWFPEMSMGLPPTVVMSWASKALPHKRVFDMVVTREPIDAATALAFGLLTEVVPPNRVTERTEERIAAMEALPTSALRDVKRFLVQVRGMDGAAAALASVDSLVMGSLRLQRT
ncbi:MAG TPA: enoyl-CoA hydratase/isomerase family protein [Actinomycetota bacterium]|nr:enoyl-CoA hydratase/isomerase family protein [Actinomycetota bacterium]